MKPTTIVVAILLLFHSALCFASISFEEEVVAEHVQQFIDRFSQLEEAELIQTIQESGLAQIVQFNYKPLNAEDNVTNNNNKQGVKASPYRPVIQMHGMGDYANNPFGMVPLKQFVSQRLNGTYVTNIALGNTTSADMLNTFFMVMDKEVETFAAAIQADENLKNGFNAIGYSQGNLIIRGYIERFNNPPVVNWISVHGPLSGVASFPRCNLTTAFCQLFADLLGDLAYNSLVQNILAQANYFRDPLRIPAYLAGDLFLADINNEKSTNNQTYLRNFASVNHTALVKALMDNMVWPNESEWFGFYKDGSQTEVVTMRNESWFLQDSFGLRTADEEGKLSFFTTPGDHLQFSEAFMGQMVDTFFTN